MALFPQLNLAYPPGLVEPGLERAEEAEEHVPAFAGDGLRPVRFRGSLRQFRTKPDIG